MSTTTEFFMLYIFNENLLIYTPFAQAWLFKIFSV